MPSSAGKQSPASLTERAVNRRGFLKTSLGATAGVVAAPTLVGWLAAADAKAATGAAAFVDSYTTNVVANLTPETNAVIRILGGMSEVWKTGDAWNTGTPLKPEVLRANVRYCAEVTAARTDAQAKEAFIYDRQHQSYAMIAAPRPARRPLQVGRQGGHVDHQRARRHPVRQDQRRRAGRRARRVRPRRGLLRLRARHGRQAGRHGARPVRLRQPRPSTPTSTRVRGA